MLRHETRDRISVNTSFKLLLEALIWLLSLWTWLQGRKKKFFKLSTALIFFCPRCDPQIPAFKCQLESCHFYIDFEKKFNLGGEEIFCQALSQKPDFLPEFLLIRKYLFVSSLLLGINYSLLSAFDFWKIFIVSKSVLIGWRDRLPITTTITEEEHLLETL